MVAWYRHDIPAWMDGTEDLEAGPYRVYHVVCQLIYLNEGPITRNDRGIAGRCNQRIDRFKVHLDKLIEIGKLKLIDGRLANDRCSLELGHIDENRVNAGKGGRTPRRQTVSDSSPHGLSEVSDRSQPPLDHLSDSSPHGHRSVEGIKLLKNNDQTVATLQNTPSLRLEKTREDKKDAASAALFDVPERPETPEVELYRRGKELLGGSAGGLITNLVKAKGGSVPLARAALETASTKQDRREYIGRVVKGAGDAPEDLRARGEAW